MAQNFGQVKTLVNHLFRSFDEEKFNKLVVAHVYGGKVGQICQPTASFMSQTSFCPGWH